MNTSPRNPRPSRTSAPDRAGTADAIPNAQTAHDEAAAPVKIDQNNPLGELFDEDQRRQLPLWGGADIHSLGLFGIAAQLRACERTMEQPAFLPESWRTVPVEQIGPARAAYTAQVNCVREQADEARRVCEQTAGYDRFKAYAARHGGIGPQIEPKSEFAMECIMAVHQATGRDYAECAAAPLVWAVEVLEQREQGEVSGRAGGEEPPVEAEASEIAIRRQIIIDLLREGDIPMKHLPNRLKRKSYAASISTRKRDIQALIEQGILQVRATEQDRRAKVCSLIVCDRAQ